MTKQTTSTRRGTATGTESDSTSMEAAVKKAMESLPVLTPAQEQAAREMAAKDAKREEHDAAQRRLRMMVEKRGVPYRHARTLLRHEYEESEAIKVYREWRIKGGAGSVLVLSGTVGCGKTLAAALAVTEGAPTDYFGAPWPDDLSPQFIDAALLQRMGLYERDGVYNGIKRCSMLAVDDLGVEFQDEKGVMRSMLDGLIDHRYRGVGWTVITTNLNRRDFEARFGGRIMSRLREHGCGFRTVKGQYREAEKSGAE